jgi:heme-degrading monooxygenase HmoA
MIMETAYISVTPGREDEFLQALEEGKAVVAQAEGFCVMHVHRGIERPSTFMLAIGWERLEDHTVGFREGPLFPQWRSIISPFFSAPPEVEHWHLYE